MINKILPVLLAGFLLVGDYRLVIEGSNVKICAQDLKSCEASREDYLKGMIFKDIGGHNAKCIKYDNCFGSRFYCIKGFHYKECMEKLQKTS